MVMRKVVTPQLVTCRGEGRLIVGIDHATGRVELGLAAMSDRCRRWQQGRRSRRRRAWAQAGRHR